MTEKSRERWRAIKRVLRAETAVKDLIRKLPPDLAGQIDLARIQKVLDDETARLDTEHDRLDSEAAAATQDAGATTALALHDATIRQDEVASHAIVMTERGKYSAAEQSAALCVIEEKLREAGRFWGSDGYAIVIVGGEECDHDSSALIGATVMADNDFPHAALLVDESRSGTATCVLQSTTGIEVGTKVKYAIGEPWKP